MYGVRIAMKGLEVRDGVAFGMQPTSEPFASLPPLGYLCRDLLHTFMQVASRGLHTVPCRISIDAQVPNASVNAEAQPFPRLARPPAAYGEVLRLIGLGWRDAVLRVPFLSKNHGNADFPDDYPLSCP